MNKLINLKVIKTIKFLTLLFILYILLLALGYSAFRMGPYQPVFIILIGIILFFVVKTSMKLDHKYILLSFFLFGITLRLLYISLIPTVQISDFEYYHNAALSLSRNVPTLTKNFGFVGILSLGYRIYPYSITGKIINLIASCISLILVYKLATLLFNKKIGLISLLLFSISLNEINMISVIGTETIAESFLLLSIVLGFFSLRSTKMKIVSLLSFLAGLSFGIGYTVRSSILFFIVLFLIIFIYFSPQRIQRIFYFILGVIISLTLVTSYHSIINGSFSLDVIMTQDSFPFLSGTNDLADGGWNEEDAKLYFSWPNAQRDELAQKEAFARIIDNPIGFLTLLPRKSYRLFAPNDYGNDWSLRYVEWKNNGFSKMVEPYILQINSLVSQSVYVIILFFAFIGLKNKIQTPQAIIFLFCSIICIAAPHLILEVQPRYHHFLIPLIIPFAAVGLLERTERNCIRK